MELEHKLKVKKILITGKDSYIGVSVEKWLGREPGCYIVDTLDMKTGKWREADFSSYDVVFHVAGIAHVSTNPKLEKLYYQINHDLAVETAEKAKAEGVNQFIFMSSIIVYGYKSSGYIDINTDPSPDNFYGKSKLQAEEGIRRLDSESFKTVILRPPMVYGRNSKGNYAKLAKLARTLPVFPDYYNRRSMVHIDNLCEFIKLTIDNDASGHYFPQNAEYTCTSEMVKLIAGLHGKKPYMTCAFNPVLKALSGSPGILNKVFGNLVYDQSMSIYKGAYDYRIQSLRRSIELTESEIEMKDQASTEKCTDKDGLVSIVMPAYNCENFIGEALNSIIGQTYESWEVIVADDCSTDRTAEIVMEFMEKDHRIKYYRLEKNQGAAVARNHAVDHASGQYMAFLDSDDLWLPDKLEKQIRFMRDNDYGFTCTSYTKIDENGNDLGRTIVAALRRDYNGVLKTCPGNSTVIYNAKKLGKFYIPDIKKRNDYVMWLQVIKKERFLYGIEEPLGSHRIRSTGISSNKSSLVGYHWRVYREIEKLSLLKSSYLIVYWVIATLFKLR